MQLRPDALGTHLAKTLAPLYVVTSGEPLLAQEACDAIRRAARAQGCTEREVLDVDRHFKWQTLNTAATSQSLFGDRTLIELRIPGGKPGRDGAQALTAYADAPPEDNVTLITLPKLDWATQKTAWVGTLQKKAVYIDIPMIERQQLPNWIGERLAAQQQRTDRHGLDFLVERTEGNLLAAHQEIAKLGLLHPPGMVDANMIRDAVMNVARYDVFKLSEAMLAGDQARLIRMLNGLKGEGEALPLVLWAVADEIRTLLKLRTGLDQGKPLPMLLKEYRIWGPREKLAGPALRRLDSRQLSEALQQAAQIDRMIKGLNGAGFAGDTWDALLQLCLKLA